MPIWLCFAMLVRVRLQMICGNQGGHPSQNPKQAHICSGCMPDYSRLPYHVEHSQSWKKMHPVSIFDAMRHATSTRISSEEKCERQYGIQNHKLGIPHYAVILVYVSLPDSSCDRDPLSNYVWSQQLIIKMPKENISVIRCQYWFGNLHRRTSNAFISFPELSVRLYMCCQKSVV